MADRVRALRADGHRVLALTIGEPDFDTPEPVKEAAVRAIREGRTKYTSADGTPELRQAVRDRLLSKTGISYAPDEICLGGGAKQVLFLAFLATLDESDEVVVPSPYWVSYPDMVLAAGGRPVIADTRAADGYKLTPDGLRAALTPRTKWVVLNSPNNPTGAVYQEAELDGLLAVLREHPGTGLLCDEIYDEISYRASPVPSAINRAPAMRERIFLVNGVSKTYAMTGWRIGYGAGSRRLCRAIALLQSQSSTCPSSVSQAAATAALRECGDFVRETVAAYARRRELLLAGIESIPGLRANVPEGGFYAWIESSELFGLRTPAGREIGTDAELTEYFLDTAGVAVIGGAACGRPGHFRAGFAAPAETISAAVRGLRRAVDLLA